MDFEQCEECGGILPDQEGLEYYGKYIEGAYWCGCDDTGEIEIMEEEDVG